MKNIWLKHSVRILVIAGALALMLTQTPQAARAQCNGDNVICAHDVCGNPDCPFDMCSIWQACHIIGPICQNEYPCEC